MDVTSIIREQLEIEGALTRKAVERVPEGMNGWKPHPKSMALGELTGLVASMPGWIAQMVTDDSMDIHPSGGPYESKVKDLDRAKWLSILDDGIAAAKLALEGTDDEKLRESWQLQFGGKTLMEKAKYLFILENFVHLAHHRGQLTVYLRLNDAEVPALYGNSADERQY